TVRLGIGDAHRRFLGNAARSLRDVGGAYRDRAGRAALGASRARGTAIHDRRRHQRDPAQHHRRAGPRTAKGLNPSMASVSASPHNVMARLGPAIHEGNADAGHKAEHDDGFDGERLNISTGLSPAGGISIEDVDPSQPLAPEVKGAVWRAFLAHHIVLFPGHFLTREQQFAFAAHFGEVEVHGAHRGETKRYDIAHVMPNLDADGNPVLRTSKPANYHWHTDKPYHAAPPMLTILRAVE